VPAIRSDQFGMNGEASRRTQPPIAVRLAKEKAISRDMGALDMAVANDSLAEYLHTQPYRKRKGTMNDQATTALRLLQAADEFRAGLAGEFSAIHGISVNEFLLMLHVEQTEANRLARSELAKRMHVSASTVTRMVAPMEKIGLVAREADERDARLGFVAMTEAGREKLLEALATFTKRAGYLLDDRLTGEDAERLKTILRRITNGSVVY
jgi:DNA-binding MarR family transcriptional regulator